MIDKIIEKYLNEADWKPRGGRGGATYSGSKRSPYSHSAIKAASRSTYKPSKEQGEKPEQKKEEPDWKVEYEDKYGQKLKDTRTGRKTEKEVRDELTKHGFKIISIKREKSSERHD
jgi:hypothetical protein